MSSTLQSHPSSANPSSADPPRLLLNEGPVVCAPRTPDEYNACDSRPDFARFVVEKAGLEFVEDEDQTWIVKDTSLTVSVWKDRSGRYVLRIRDPWFPTRAKKPRESLCLPELYAIAFARDATQIPGGQELPRWRWRALVEGGWLKPASVHLPPLPEHAPSHARATFVLLRSLLEIRWLGDPPDEPFSFSCPFLARWADPETAIDENTIRRGKWWLETRGFLQRSGTAPSGHAERDTVLWTVPGASKGGL